MRSAYILILFFFSSLFISAQDKPYADYSISLLTVGPGPSLVDNFGHSAIRVKSNTNDYVFNYGIYDFDDPNFYAKFTQGRLLYKLGVQSFNSFKRGYEYQNRWVKEQHLDITLAQKEAVVSFLLENAKSENQYYKYDYFINNCATKPYDILKYTIGFKLDDKSIPSESITYRSIIHARSGINSWGSFGIDLALGSLIDRELTIEELTFLPDYLYEIISSSENLAGKPIVKKDKKIVQAVELDQPFNFFGPFPFFLLISLLIIWITYKNYRSQKRSKWVDTMVFLFTGMVGIVLLFLWFGTDHIWTKFNYNLLWAFPLNLILIQQSQQAEPKNWFKKYLKLLVILLCLMTLHWTIGIQQFAPSLMPLIIALIVRYLYLISSLKKD